MTGLAYAYHFDASLYAAYLRAYAEGRGVTRSEGIVSVVSRHGESGDIRSITLDSGREIAGDFFIDCTGFRALLLGQELGVGDFKSEYEGDGGDGGTVLSGGDGNTLTINVVVGGSVIAICVLSM